MTHTTLPAGKEKLFPLEERSQTDQIVLECSLQKGVDRCNFKLKDGYEGQQIDTSSVSDINIGKRFRKDPGDIDDLVESLKNNPLLCPAIVTKDHLLIDGLRIEACKRLNKPDIPVHIVDISIKENGEIDANVVRKDHTIEEIVAIKRFRESTEPTLQRQRNDLELPGKFPRSDNNQRREERIAKSTGVSYKTLQKAEKIVDAAQKTLRSSATCQGR